MLAQNQRRTSPLRAVSQVEDDQYAAFVQRVLHDYGRCAGNGDVEALALMLGLAEEIGTAIAEAVKGLRFHGYSWAEIGSRLGITPPGPPSSAGEPLTAAG